MSNFEVQRPILNSPYKEPELYWWIMEGQPPEQRTGRRPSMYYYRLPGRDQNERGAIQIELKLVNLIRERVAAWRQAGWAGVTRTTHELLQYWQREGREKRLFFAQLEAAETIIFLHEARADFRQGIDVPRDEPGDDAKEKGYTGFLRHACKMATGSGKTTVMGLLAAWSILNKVAGRGDARFSDVVLIVCPNVTIRSRLRELDPELDEASLYRTRDLVPAHLMPQLRQGRVVTTNWHVFEPQSPHTAGDGGRVVKAGVPVQTTETIQVGAKTTTARGSRYLTLADFERQRAAGVLEIVDDQRDAESGLGKVKVRATRYVESDTALVQRVLRDAGGKQNILVMNDEAHHAYRIRKSEPDPDEADLQWILQPGRLTPSERGAKLSGGPKAEAVLKWANHPIAMLGGLWEQTLAEWRGNDRETRPPVFILVCKNTALANVIHDWLANGKNPTGIPPANLPGFRNTETETNTILVHSKVVHETDTGAAKSEEARWMRFTLDTVGRREWPRDSLGHELYPGGFVELANVLERPLHPPGRDVRCIVSVGMLTEGWDCNTVTHIVGLRPFMSQLLCEQVVGRGLRRASLRSRRGRIAHRGGGEGLRRAVPDRALQGQSDWPYARADQAASRSSAAAAFAAGDQISARRELHAGGA